MRPGALLTITAVAEVGTGMLLLLWPTLVLALLFGWRLASSETVVMGRVAAAGVLSIGVAGWAARREASTPPVLAAVLAYNAVGAAVLLFAGAGLGMAGVLLWPAVAYHVALAGWSGACLRRRPEATRA
jgi:hypothetical protein